MDDHVDRGVIDIVQPACLDDLQALVGERRRVDRDLGPHRPGRVAEGLVRGHRRQVRRPVEERPARRGQDERGDPVQRLPDEALPDRRVLRIDRAEPGERAGHRVARGRRGDRRRAGSRLRHHEMAPRDERLLVGGCHDLAGAERGEDGPEADDPAGGDDDEIDVVAGRDGLEAVRLVLGQDRLAWSMTRSLIREQSLVPTRGEGDDLERVGMGGEDVERLRPDRPGRAEDRHAASPRRAAVSDTRRRHRGRPPERRRGTSRPDRGAHRDPGSAARSPSPLPRA